MKDLKQILTLFKQLMFSKEDLDENVILYPVYFSSNYIAELLYMKIFFRRLPHYRSWTKVFNINNPISLEEHKIDSIIEGAILDFLTDILKSSEKLYIECYKGHETSKALEKGIPITAARLGYKLLKPEFTWFKN